MTDPTNKNDGTPPLGQSISDIVDRTTTIVHEEIELAKAELAISLQNILRGSVAGIVGGVFAFFGLFVLLIGISFLISDLIDFGLWPGFLIVALLLFIFGGLLAWVALKKIKKGSDQIVPEQAIAEARATQAALKTELEGQAIDSVAVEETGVTAGAPAVTPPPATKPAPGKDKQASPQDAKAAEAADLLAAAKEVVEQPAASAEPPAPKFVTERTDLPYGESDKSTKAATKAEAKAAKAAAKAQAKAEKEAAKQMKAAEKEAAKAQKEADKALKKAGKSKSQPAEPEAPSDTSSSDEGGDQN